MAVNFPTSRAPPSIHFFLAILIKLGGNRLGLFLATQCVLGTLTCVLTALLAARWLRPQASLLAGLLVALDPNSILRCSDLRTETLFTLLFVAGICLIVWCPNKTWSWLAVGLLWSLAALTRPIAIWIWLAALVIIFTRRFSWRDTAACLTAFFIGFLPLEGVWAARNHTLTGHYFISTISTYNLLMYRAAGIKAEQKGQTQEEAEQEFLAQYGDIQFVESREKFAQSLQEYQRAIAEKLFSAPRILVKEAVIGCGKLLLGPGVRSLDNSLSQTKPSSKWWAPVYSAALLVVVLLSFVGVRRLGWGAIVPAILLLYFAVLSSGPESNSRFRVPVTPLLTVLAAAGICGTEKQE